MITASDKQLLALFGKPLEHEAVGRAVSELSPVPVRELEVKRGMVDVRAPAHGLDLTFTTVDKLQDAPALALPAAGFVLAAIFFHSEGFEGYRGYASTLPFGLSFAQSRAAVRALLGVPSGTSARHKNDRWDFDALYVTVDFNENEQSSRLVTVGVPWKPRQTA